MMPEQYRDLWKVKHQMNTEQQQPFVADNRFEITCGHCGDKFWAFDLLHVKLCRSCFLLGHRGNGGTCWKCRSDYYSADEPFATHGDD